MPPVPQPRAVAREILNQLYAVLPVSIRAPSSPFASPATTPTKSASLRRFVTLLVPRQQITPSTVPATYGAVPSGPDGGTVVGIVLGSVAGFLLLLWLIYTCMNFGNVNNQVTAIDTETVGDASEVTRRSKRSRRHSHSHKHHSPRRETVEVRTTTRQMPPPPSGGERIIMTERSRSRGPPPMPGPPPPGPIIDDDDEVVVIEEHTPSRRSRGSKHRSRERRRSSGGPGPGPGGYREVDPHLYAGGDAPMREMRRESRERRR